MEQKGYYYHVNDPIRTKVGGPIVSHTYMNDDDGGDNDVIEFV